MLKERCQDPFRGAWRVSTFQAANDQLLGFPQHDLSVKSTL